MNHGRALRPAVLVGLALVATVISLGSTWAFTAPTPGIGGGGTTILVNQFNPSTGDLDLVPSYLPTPIFGGNPGQEVAGYADDVRVLLVPAVVLLGLAVISPGDAQRARKHARWAGGLLTVAGLWGLAQGSGRGPLLALVAAASLLVATRRSAAGPPVPGVAPTPF